MHPQINILSNISLKLARELINRFLKADLDEIYDDLIYLREINDSIIAEQIDSIDIKVILESWNLKAKLIVENQKLSDLILLISLCQ